MKLTKDQIEIERKKFNVYMDQIKFDLSGNSAYRLLVKEQQFQGWLACRESNNEITLNIALCGFDSGYKRIYNEAIEDVKELLELQGFTVKSQGE